MRLIECYGVPTLGVALNGEGSTEEGLKQAQSELRERLGIPVIRPLEEGVGELIPVIRRLIEERQR